MSCGEGAVLHSFTGMIGRFSEEVAYESLLFSY